MSPDVQRLARYHEQGDKSALDELFVRHYPAVYQTILHLVFDSFDAKDLAQATFLKAIRSVESFDGSGSFRAWLLTIAVNEVRQFRRRHAQRSKQDWLYDALQRVEVGSSASDDATRREFEQQLERALERMPAELAEPLVLHYYESLSFADIASVLSLSKSTVQSRVHRAIARLRKEFRGAGALAMLPCIERFIEVPASAVGSAVVGNGIVPLLACGGLMTKMQLMVCGVIAAGVAWFLFDSVVPSAGSPQVPSDEPAPTAQSSSMVDSATRAVDLELAAPVEGSSPGRQPIASDSPLAVTLNGRCIDALTKAPVPGVVIELSSRAGMRFSARGEAFAFDSPTAIKTGADGRFSMSFDVTPDWHHELRLRGAGLVPMSTVTSPLAPGVIDYGDIEIVRGCRVHGRLADTRDRPLLDQRIMFTQNAMIGQSRELEFTKDPRREPDSAFYQKDSFVVRSLEDGSFEFTDPIPPGRWYVRLWERRALVAKTAVLIEVTEASKWLELVAEPATGVLAGIVVDDAGSPVEGAWVKCVLSNGDDWSLKTDENGTFETPRLERDPDGRVKVSAGKRHFERMAAEEHSWDSTAIRLVLSPGGVVEVVVTDASTGEPVTDYGVRIFRIPDYLNVTTSASLLRHIGKHAGGRCKIAGVKRGQNLVMVEPRRTDLEPSWFVPVDVTDRARVVNIQLQPPVQREVLVVDTDGSPVAGSEVWLVKSPGTKPVSVKTRLVRRPMLGSMWMRDAVLLTEGTTDARGACILRSAPARGLTILVTGKSISPVSVEGVELRSGMEPLRVVAEAGARVEGIVRAHELFRELNPGLRLVDATDSQRVHPDHGKRRVAIAADGSFGFVNVPTGDWRLELLLRGRRPVTLMDVAALRGGEVRRIVANASMHAPGRLRGRVLLGGQPVSTEVQLITVDVNEGTAFSHTTYKGSTSDAAGHFELAGPPGAYRLMVKLPDRPSERIWLKSLATVQLLADKESHQEFDFPMKRVSVRVLNADNTSAKSIEWRVLWQKTVWSTVKADPEGRLVIDPAPPGPFEIATWPPELATRDAWNRYRREHPVDYVKAMIKLGPIDATKSESVDLRMPPPK